MSTNCISSPFYDTSLACSLNTRHFSTFWKPVKSRSTSRIDQRWIIVAYCTFMILKPLWISNILFSNGATKKESFILFPILCGLNVRCTTVVHFLPRQSLLFESTPHSIQPSSLRSSSLPSPFHFHRPPSYVELLSSHHMPIPLQPTFPFFAFPPIFAVLLILSFLIILSSFVTLHIHRSILISATSNFSPCAFFNAHVSAPYTSAGITTVLYTFPLICTFILLSHNTPDTLFQFTKKRISFTKWKYNWNDVKLWCWSLSSCACACFTCDNWCRNSVLTSFVLLFFLEASWSY